MEPPAPAPEWRVAFTPLRLLLSGFRGDAARRAARTAAAALGATVAEAWDERVTHAVLGEPLQFSEKVGGWARASIGLAWRVEL